MPLFGSGRDSLLIKHFNKEIMHRIVGIEVEVYKLAISEMQENLYGETAEKKYNNPVRMYALVTGDSTTVINNEQNILDVEKTLSIGFIRQDLVDKDLVVEVSDIINWDGGYYQVDNVRTTSYWWGRNEESLIGYQQSEHNKFGYNISVIAEVHRTAITNLNIVETRSGINPPNRQYKKPKNL